MVEALDLFESVVKNCAFHEISIMLFLNKKDISTEKVLYLDIGAVAHFSDCDGTAEDFEEVE